MTVKVMFVCLGNICRSPTAHGVFQSLINREGLQSRIQVESSGTASWHVGKAPDERSTAVAAARGVDLSGLRAQQFSASDFEIYDYILVMDKQNLRDVVALQPSHYHGVVDLFLAFGEVDCEEVPDPYYGGEQGFERVLDLVESASKGLLTHILQKEN